VSNLHDHVQVPTINQETGIAGSEPTETLMKTRSGKVIRPDAKNKNKVRHLVTKLSLNIPYVLLTCLLLMQVYFGQNMVWNWMDSSAKRSGKIIQVGDPVFVLRKVSSAAEAAA